MDIQQQIEQHEAEVCRLKAIQIKCAHHWDAPYQDYEDVSVPIVENQPRGSDFFNPVTIGWDTVKKPVWRRKCAACGLKQTTTKTEPVIERHRPVF